MGNESLPLLKGTLDLLILKALSWGPMHGYGIATWLEQRSGGDLGVDDSALYQALHRLDARGLLEAEWGVSENNRRARYYRLTETGRGELAPEEASWRRHVEGVALVLGAG